MKKKKIKNINRPDAGRKDKRAETITILIIVLFALFGLIFGYVMYQEFSGQEQFEKIENEK